MNIIITRHYYTTITSLSNIITLSREKQTEYFETLFNTQHFNGARLGLNTGLAKMEICFTLLGLVAQKLNDQQIKILINRLKLRSTDQHIKKKKGKRIQTKGDQQIIRSKVGNIIPSLRNICV